ncbi:PREDICTED: uncharacterized protein LOC104608528 [Nelumbo nucifera]|uniref:Uncharacterized protein LOC104608528 n=2 Tax=Nelumbo nucifera TaxID=4432 RepID=A0A1U8B175_NELNU|nr:PREDICTED: uncharacterized protein LOC104608528 [Nelumbo nucifera]DAD39552.1 TPA_asm: hypothetical protein HUJ06_013875 [Nelumbo nucifera]
MATPSHDEYTEFEEKMKRTVYIDNLSPQVTASVIKAALEQLGEVVNVQFIPNYIELKDIPQCALVEMASAKQAESIIMEMTNCPFMMSGMPRPVRARAAEVEMFDDLPVKPGRRIQCRWVDPKDPDFKVARKLKYAIRKQAAEASVMLKYQLEEEKKLADQQVEVLKVNCKKYDIINGISSDDFDRLAGIYNMSLPNN